MIKHCLALIFGIAFLAGCGNEPPQVVPNAGVPVAIGLSKIRHSVDDYYAKHVQRVSPAVNFVKIHVQQNGTIPTQRVFQDWACESGAHMLVIRNCNNEYARKHGAKHENDFMVGTWMSDWYFYYKSWDEEYIDASDEPPTGYRLE